jgi:hypothetical protein
MKSNMARLPDAAREFLGLVQKVERGEIVRSADIVLSSLAGPEKNAGVAAKRRLGRLYIEMIGVQGDFAGDGDAAFVGSKVEFVRRKAERIRELLELAARLCVEQAFGVVIVGNGLSEIDSLGRF